MSDRVLDTRTQLLLTARVVNGVGVLVSDEDEDSRWVMQQMVEEGLFTHSDALFSEGYWWTAAGKRAAEEAWQRVSIQQFDTRYRDNPHVRISLNGCKEEICRVIAPGGRGPDLWVRESSGRWLVDHPNGQENVPFASADEAIEWALEQIGEPCR